MEILLGILALIASIAGVYYTYRQFVLQKGTQQPSLITLTYGREISTDDRIVVGDTTPIRLRILNKGAIEFHGQIHEYLPEGTQLVSGKATWAGKLAPTKSVTLQYELGFSEVGAIHFGNPSVRTERDVGAAIEIVCEHSVVAYVEHESPANVSLIADVNPRRLVPNQPFQITLRWHNTGSEKAQNVTYSLNYPDAVITLAQGESDYELCFDLDRFASVEHRLTLTAFEMGEFTIALQDIRFENGLSQVHSLPPCRIHLEIEFDWKASLVGRDHELGILLRNLDNAENWRGNLVLVHGEAGIGKSYLIEALLKEARQRRFLCLEASCESFNEAWAFYPFRRIFDEYLSLTDLDTVRDKATRAQAGLISLKLDLQPYAGVLTHFLIGEDTNGGEQSALMASPRELRGRFLLATYKLLEAIAESQPLIVFIDDLQFADSGTVDLLQYLASEAAGLRLLILGAIRSEELTHTRMGEPHPLLKSLQEMRIDGSCKEIFLEPLAKEDCFRLLASLYPVSDFPQGFGDILVEETEGNPLYIREVLKSLMDKRIVVRNPDGVWILARRVSAFDVPDTVEQVIKIRLGYLTEDEARELEKASVIGKDFAYRLLKGLSELDEETLIEYLGEYLDHYIVIELDTENEIYRFSHGKIQEVVYQEMQAVRRRLLHHRVAELLENIYADSLVEFSPIIAHHYYYSGNDQKALEYLTMAGIENSRVYANEEAVRSFNLALNIVGKKKKSSSTLQASLDLKSRLASVYREMNDFAQAERLYGEALSIAEHLGDRPKVGLLLSRRAEAFAIWGAYDVAEKLYEECQETARQIDDQKLLLQLFNDLADLHWWRCRKATFEREHQEANTCRDQILMNATRALELAERLGDQDAVVRSHKNLGNYYFMVSEYSKALSHFEDAVRVAEVHNLIRSKYVYEKVGKLYRLIGRSDQAIDAYNKYVAWAVQIGAQWAQLKAYQVLGLLSFEEGEHVRALDLLDQSMELNRIVKSKHEDIETLIIKGRVLQKLGRSDEAMDCYHQALRLRGVPEAEMEEMEPSILLKKVGMEMYARGELAQAKDLLTRYRGLAPDISPEEQRELEDLLVQCDSDLDILQELGR